MIKCIEASSSRPMCEGCCFNKGIHLSSWCAAPPGTPECVAHDTDGRLIEYIFVEDSDEAKTC